MDVWKTNKKKLAAKAFASGDKRMQPLSTGDATGRLKVLDFFFPSSNKDDPHPADAPHRPDYVSCS